MSIRVMFIGSKRRRAIAFHVVLDKAYIASHEEGPKKPEARDIVDGAVTFNQIELSPTKYTSRYKKIRGTLSDKAMAKELYIIVREMAYETATAFNQASQEDRSAISKHVELNQALIYFDKAYEVHKARTNTKKVKSRDDVGLAILDTAPKEGSSDELDVPDFVK